MHTCGLHAIWWYKLIEYFGALNLKWCRENQRDKKETEEEAFKVGMSFIGEEVQNLSTKWDYTGGGVWDEKMIY